MEYVWQFLAPFAKDKTVWLSIAAWLLKLLNAPLHLGLDDHMITAGAGLMSTWAVTHLSHVKVFGGDGKIPPVAQVDEPKQ